MSGLHRLLQERMALENGLPGDQLIFLCTYSFPPQRSNQDQRRSGADQVFSIEEDRAPGPPFPISTHSLIPEHTVCSAASLWCRGVRNQEREEGGSQFQNPWAWPSRFSGKAQLQTLG